MMDPENRVERAAYAWALTEFCHDAKRKSYKFVDDAAVILAAADNGLEHPLVQFYELANAHANKSNWHISVYRQDVRTSFDIFCSYGLDVKAAFDRATEEVARIRADIGNH